MATEQNMGEPAKITLKTKLIQLGRVRDKWDNTLKAGKEQVIQGHIESLYETLKEVSKWYRTVKVEKITSKIAQEEINTWNDDVEEQMEEADKKIRLLKQWLSDTEDKQEDQQ